MRMGALNEERALGLRCFRKIGLLPAVLLGACASPGPPRPPSLNLPEVVTTLAAERVGDRVQLHWTTPEKTTDGLAVRGPMRATICRTALSPKRACAVVDRLPVTAGASGAVDHLPPSLVIDTARALEYRIEILNAGGRSSGESNAASVASGPAPPSPERLQAAVSERGAVLTWQPTGAQDAVELHRVTTSPATAPVKQPAVGIKRADAADVVLRVPPGAGALDRTAEMGRSYVYTAQEVRTVTVDGHLLEVRSAVSGHAAVEMRDVFPPRRPAGLAVVAGDRVVDLSWEPNTESDLAGYFVFRQEGGSSVQLNPSPVAGPAFQDKSAVSDHTYRYSVVAVDRADNRSPASEPAQASIRSAIP